jgi:hypothetical protein
MEAPGTVPSSGQGEEQQDSGDLEVDPCNSAGRPNAMVLFSWAKFVESRLGQLPSSRPHAIHLSEIAAFRLQCSLSLKTGPSPQWLV